MKKMGRKAKQTFLKNDIDAKGMRREVLGHRKGVGGMGVKMRL